MVVRVRFFAEPQNGNGCVGGQKTWSMSPAGFSRRAELTALLRMTALLAITPHPNLPPSRGKGKRGKGPHDGGRDKGEMEPRVWVEIGGEGGYSRGMRGRVTWEGYSASWKIVCRAGTSRVSDPMGPPVLALRSNRGKLLLETSSRIRCPFLNTLLVAQRSMAYS